MTRQARIAKLEANRGGAGDGPAVLFRCDAITGEPFTARLMGGGRLVREPGETSDAFTARALQSSSLFVATFSAQTLKGLR